MKAVFFGTPSFAAKILAFLLENGIEITAIVTQPDKIKNHVHISDVKKLCLAKNLKQMLFQPLKASDPVFLQAMKQTGADLFLVAAYGQILKKELLDIPKYGSINVHSSLLPKYRGAAPMQRAIMAGDKETGITIMQMNEKMDEGDILNQEKIPLSLETNMADLEDMMVKIAGPLLLKTVKELEKGVLQGKQQEHSLATYAPKIKPEEYWLDWQKPAESLQNQIRALSPQPGARCWVEIDGQRKLLKVLKAQVVENKHHLNHREVLRTAQNLLFVGCQKNSLQLQVLQLEGKKALAAADFLRGLKNQIFFI